MLRATLVSVLLAGVPTALAAQRPDPLGQLVAEALRTNLGLEGERLAERRAAAEVREARGLFLPSLGLQSRYSRLGGVPNIGDLINPAYATLNQLTGTNRFPTNINFTLPQRHESRLELVQPIFNAGILANYSVARARAAGQGMQLAAAARQLVADVQVAYLQEASARRAVELYEATLPKVRGGRRPRRSSPACPWRWTTASRVPISRSVAAMTSGSRPSSCRGTSSTAAATRPDGPWPDMRPIAPVLSGKISRTGSRSR